MRVIFVKRLIASTHSPMIAMEVLKQQQMNNNDATKQMQASESYLISRRLLMSLPLTMCNEWIYLVMNAINRGFFDDISNVDMAESSPELWSAWQNRTTELLKAEGVLLEYDNMLSAKQTQNKTNRIIEKLK